MHHLQSLDESAQACSLGPEGLVDNWPVSVYFDWPDYEQGLWNFLNQVDGEPIQVVGDFDPSRFRFILMGENHAVMCLVER